MKVSAFFCFVLLAFTGVNAADSGKPQQGEPVGAPELDPARSKYFGPLPVPPGTPVIDAADRKAVEAHLFRLVVVRFTVEGREKVPSPPEFAQERYYPKLKGTDFRISLSMYQRERVNKALGIDTEPPGPGPVLYAAGIPHWLYENDGKHMKAVPGMNIYCAEQIGASREEVMLPWQNRPWFTPEWKSLDAWYPLPGGMKTGEGPVNAAVRVQGLSMRHESGAAVVAPVFGNLTPGPGDGRVMVNDSILSKSGYLVREKWSYVPMLEVMRHHEAGRKWPRGAEMNIHYAWGDGSPWDGPEPVNEAASAVAVEALLSRLTLRTDAAFAAGLGEKGALKPVKLLTERIAAAKAAGFVTVVVAKEGVEEASGLAAHVLGGMEFLNMQVFAAATVEEAAQLLSEAARPKLDAVSNRLASLKNAGGPEKLLTILQRDAAVRELTALATGAPASVSAMVLKRAGRKEVPLIQLSAQKKDYTLPVAVAVARLREMTSWNWVQFVERKGTSYSGIVTGSTAFARNHKADVEALLPRLPDAVKAKAGAAAAGLAAEAVKYQDERAAGGFGDDSAIERLRQELKRELDALAAKR